jgi:maltose alpha-D-glucosyltransferase/alpha-amylase
VEDFHRLTQEAHARGIRIIADLVLNHTSDQHAWFQESRKSRDNPFRDYYVWSDTDGKYSDARVIFSDTESSNWTWDHTARQYYWHRFYSHQPDLNYDNPAVRQEVLQVMAFWLDQGIDGFRVDAVPYLFEREGTNCENLPESHAFLREMRRFVDEHYPGTLLLAEANQWPTDLLAYFGDGDEFHMAFNFPLMPRMFMAIRREDRRPIVDIMQLTPAIPLTCQWALFLRNHDELTLEMVTDEERDYMYREYAKDPRMRLNLGIRRRLAPLMENGRSQIELMHSLLFSLPGCPVIYYGDEIGMGDNIYLGDRRGVRTPMHWSGDRNAGFSRADPSQLYMPVISDPQYHYQAVNVEAQLRSPSSLLNWLRRLIAVRKQCPMFAWGSLKFIDASNERVVAYVREFQNERALVVNNLSRFAQPADLDLREYQGMVPVEMLGGQLVRPIGEERYTVTLSPHTFFWFRLAKPLSGRG